MALDDEFYDNDVVGGTYTRIQATLAVERLFLIGEVLAVEFSTLSPKYVVKNFSDDDIFVSFDEDFNPLKAIKISSGYAQTCMISEYVNINNQIPDTYFAKTIYIYGTGEVEVQQILWE